MSLATARFATEKAGFRPALPLVHLPGITEMQMSRKRKSLSKKTRFEVFKRDSFKCQYCGASAPDVVLEVDHIDPISKDGADEMVNYITACRPCNAGKSDRTLDDSSTLAKQRAQLEDLSERREQLEMMMNWRSGLKDITDLQVDQAAAAWSEGAKGWSLNEKGTKELRALIKKYGIAPTFDAIDTAIESYIDIDSSTGKATQESVDKAWKKLGGILALRNLGEDQRGLHYVKGILRNRINYVPFDVIRQLKDALDCGVTVDDMKLQAKNCRNWNDFSEWLDSASGAMNG